MDTWADKIAALESRGWTLTGIGRAIELSPQALSDIKQGRSSEPRGMSAVLLHNLFSTGAKPVRRTPAATGETAEAAEVVLTGKSNKPVKVRAA